MAAEWMIAVVGTHHHCTAKIVLKRKDLFKKFLKQMYMDDSFFYVGLNYLYYNFSSFEAGIANAISSFKWRKKFKPNLKIF